MPAAKLQQGDRVTFIDEVGGAVVLRPGRPGHVLVRTDDGFELEQPEKRLVKVDEEKERAHMRVSDHQAGMIKANDLADDKRRQKPAIRPGKTAPKPEDNSVAEVDLHLHELVEDETRLSQGEKLEYQVRYFERALEDRKSVV